MLEIVFNATVVAGTAILVYHHVMYPLLLPRLARRWGRTEQRGNSETVSTQQETAQPTITIIIPAHNEQKFIAAKIRNIAEIDYPRFKAVIALDGCSDLTGAIALDEVRQIGGSINLELVDYQRNVGKVSVLNEQIARADSDIVALSDTSAMIPRDALWRAAAHFRDPSVGFVAAGYELNQAGSEGERAYMAQLRRVRLTEASLDTPLGAHGALYFFRRALFQPLPPDTINDDFVLPMQIAAQGYRGVYDDDIVATELETTKREQEFRRRVRIGAGNFQQTIRLPALASPTRPWLAFMFVSGKGLRPFIPFVAILVAICSAWRSLDGSVMNFAVLITGLIAMLLGLLAIALRGHNLPRLLDWLGYILEGHWASLLGALRYMRGGRISYWQKAKSNSPSHEPRFQLIWPTSMAADSQRPGE